MRTVDLSHQRRAQFSLPSSLLSSPPPTRSRGSRPGLSVLPCAMSEGDPAAGAQQGQLARCCQGWRSEWWCWSAVPACWDTGLCVIPPLGSGDTWGSIPSTRLRGGGCQSLENVTVFEPVLAEWLESVLWLSRSAAVLGVHMARSCGRSRPTAARSWALSHPSARKRTVQQPARSWMGPRAQRSLWGRARPWLRLRGPEPPGTAW